MLHANALKAVSVAETGAVHVVTAVIVENAVIAAEIGHLVVIDRRDRAESERHVVTALRVLREIVRHAHRETVHPDRKGSARRAASVHRVKVVKAAKERHDLRAHRESARPDRKASVHLAATAPQALSRGGSRNLLQQPLRRRPCLMCKSHKFRRSRVLRHSPLLCHQPLQPYLKRAQPEAKSDDCKTGGNAAGRLALDVHPPVWNA
jgi:hypothetical protein